MSAPFEERLANRKQEEARAAFVNYTQNIAFNMTLSRSMVDLLGLIRDGDATKTSSHSHFVGIISRLERRGLIWHDYIKPTDAPVGHRYFKLTRAGELMCGLLVEAKLLAATPEKKGDIILDKPTPNR